LGKQIKAVATGGVASVQAIGHASMTLLNQAATLSRRGVVRVLELASVFGLLGLRLARQYRLPLLTAAVAGVAVGLTAFGAGHFVAAVVCRLGNFLTTVWVTRPRQPNQLASRPRPWPPHCMPLAKPPPGRSARHTSQPDPLPHSEPRMSPSCRGRVPMGTPRKKRGSNLRLAF
jgi:hypothetical protein